MWLCKTTFHPLLKSSRNGIFLIRDVICLNSVAAILNNSSNLNYNCHLNRRCNYNFHRIWHHSRLLQSAASLLRITDLNPFHKFPSMRRWPFHDGTISHLCSRTTLFLNFSSNPLVVPVARKRPMMKEILGCKWQDEYAWMEQGLSEDFLNYIDEENKFSDQYFGQVKELQEEMRAHITQYDQTVSDEPEVQIVGDYAYFPDISENGSSIFYRRNLQTGKEQVVLDSSNLMELYGYSQVIVTSFKISPCQRYLGAVVEIGPEMYDGHIVKMDDEQCDLMERIRNISNMEFMKEFIGEESVLYTKQFDLQAKEVWKHQIGTAQETDVRTFKEENKRFFVDLSHTKDRQYTIININSHTTSELWIIDNQRVTPEAPLMFVWPRQDGVACYLDHCGDTFFAVSNIGVSSELKILKAQTSPGLHHSKTFQWESLYNPPPGHVIQDMDVFASHCVLALQVNNIPQVAVIKHTEGMQPMYIELPPEYTMIVPSLNPDINSPTYHFQLSSPVHPSKNFKVDLNTGNVEIQESVEGTEREDEPQFVDSNPCGSRKPDVEFACKRLFAQSQDGTRVPITIIHREDLTPNGQHPMLVLGYGAYGRNVEMDYRAERRALVDAGWVLAFCHVRGGGELGRQWYHSGRAEQKHHSFEDFASCIEFLHSSGYSQPELTAGWAASAGALLLGVLCNQRPELLRAAVMRMPFVDILSSMVDDRLPLTSQDIEEWGDPSGSAADLDCISKYCPYHNIISQTYPSMLITSSNNDHRVPTWVPVKYVARLRNRTRDCPGRRSPTFLLKVHQDGGHFGPDNDDGGIDQASMEWTFLHRELSLDG